MLDLKQRLDATLQMVGEFVKAEWVQNIVNNGVVDLGQYKNSIEVVNIPNGIRVQSNIGGVGGYLPYPFYQEYGTGIYAESGNGRKTPWFYFNRKFNKVIKTQGIRPRPCMRPALYNNTDTIKEMFKKGMQNERN